MHDITCTCNRCAFGYTDPAYKPMTPAEFKPLAELHGLHMNWLAKHIGRVSERTFRYWCNGRLGTNQRVPTDAVERMRALNEALSKVLA